MAIVCAACRHWVGVTVNQEAQSVRCGECGHEEPIRLLPLFIVTGTSGVGKTAVIAELRRFLPEWEVFDTDILWDSGGNYQRVKCNWLRIAYSIAQSGRPTILCGTILPSDLASCDHLPFFRRIHYAALHCDDDSRAARLRARPGVLACSEAFIAEHHRFARWFVENAETAFDAPLTLLDTTHTTVEETAHQLRDWVTSHYQAIQENR